MFRVVNSCLIKKFYVYSTCFSDRQRRPFCKCKISTSPDHKHVIAISFNRLKALCVLQRIPDLTTFMKHPTFSKSVCIFLLNLPKEWIPLYHALSSDLPNTISSQWSLPSDFARRPDFRLNMLPPLCFAGVLFSLSFELWCWNKASFSALKFEEICD